MQHTHLGPRADALVQSITDGLLEDSSIPTAIMAGHEVVSKNGTYSDVFGAFPETSRAIGKAVIERTRERLSSIKLFALINDWYELRDLPEDQRGIVRARHWDDPGSAFPEESDPAWREFLLEGRGLKKSARPMGRFSEYVLQQSFRSQYGHRAIGRLSQECNLCSSEIVMMASKLYRRGIRRILSFIPNVCTRAVDHGSLMLERGEFQRDGLRFDESMELTNVYLNAAQPWDENEVLAENARMTHILRTRP